jgi:hypothetical protein
VSALPSTSSKQLRVRLVQFPPIRLPLTARIFPFFLLESLSLADMCQILPIFPVGFHLAQPCFLEDSVSRNAGWEGKVLDGVGELVSPGLYLFLALLSDSSGEWVRMDSTTSAKSFVRCSGCPMAVGIVGMKSFLTRRDGVTISSSSEMWPESRLSLLKIEVEVSLEEMVEVVEL